MIAKIKKTNNNLKEMYNILIENLLKTYPTFHKDDYYNDEKFIKWSTMIKNNKNYHILAYKKENKIIGFLSYSINNKQLWISECQIKKEYINNRILKNLIKEFTAINNIQSYDIVTIHINSNNELSQKVFKHIGFKFIGNTIYQISLEKLKKWANII